VSFDVPMIQFEILEDTYLEVIDDADITNKHSDNYEMVD
jgi:hypothetical protein